METHAGIFAAIRLERKRQDEKWGPGHDPGDSILLAVLVEEVGEVANALNDGWPNLLKVQLAAELVQVAAVAVRWLELLEGENGRESGMR